MMVERFFVTTTYTTAPTWWDGQGDPPFTTDHAITKEFKTEARAMKYHDEQWDFIRNGHNVLGGKVEVK